MRTRKLDLILVLTLVAFLASPLRAAVCIPPAEGVFGNPTPPHWWDNVPPQAVYFQKIDDPRWVGSGTITYGDGSSTMVDFRGLHGDGTTNIYLSWRIFVAPAASANQNVLYVGLERAGGAGPMILSVSLPTLVPSQAVAGSLTANALNGDGSLGGVVALPWLTETARVWINNPTANSFAVQIRVPKSALQMTGSNFNMWYQVLGGTPSSQQFAYAWPRTSYLGPPTVLGQIATFPVPSTPGAWDSFLLSTGPADPGCSSSGVSLAYSQIGTTNVPSNSVKYRKIPPGVPPAPVNTFFAAATNKSGNAIGAGELRARFRLANWGSMPGQESGVDPNVLWSTIPGGDSVPNSAMIANNTTAGAANDNRFNWTLSNADIIPYENGTRSADNCLLVELTSTTGLTFTNNSIRRNMMFGAASTFVHSAEISIRGLTPIAPDGRDVYLLVETVNMPAQITPPPPDDRGGVPVNFVGDDPTGNPQGPQSVEDFEKAAASGALTDEQMDAFVPTYRIHVFHDSGTVINGRPILIPQGGFGYRVIHEGDLLGWAHETVGEDVTLTEIAPNFYRIAKVPNDGVVHVKTKIEALEPHGGDGQWRAFLDLGTNFPDGSGIDGEWSGNLGIERMFAHQWSVEGIVGYHTFEAQGRFDLEVWQLSLNAMRFFGTGPLQPYVFGGAGLYDFDPGQSEFGVNAGLGLLWELNAKWGVEGVFNYHTTDSLDWSTAQVGVRWHF